MQVSAVQAFKDNYVWFIGEPDSPHTVIVDPGEAEPVLAEIDRRQLEPVAILITHHHPDHVGGLAALLERFEIPVFGPANERVAEMTHPVGEGDTVEIEQLATEFSVLDVPGHTAGHIAFVHPEALFCGDTLFTGGCGKLFEGTPKQMFESLDKLRQLDPQCQVYCGHEYTLANLDFARQVEPENPDIQKRIEDAQALLDRGEPAVPASLALECATNPFLRWDVEAVRSAAERYAGGPLREDWEVFAALRQWKDDIDAAD